MLIFLLSSIIGLVLLLFALMLLADNNIVCIPVILLSFIFFLISFTTGNIHYYQTEIKKMYNYHSVSCKESDTIPDINTYLCNTYTIDSNNALIKQTNLFATNPIFIITDVK